VGPLPDPTRGVPETSGAELDRVAGINNYGRVSLTRWRDSGRIPTTATQQQAPGADGRLRCPLGGDRPVCAAEKQDCPHDLLVILMHPHRACSFQPLKDGIADAAMERAATTGQAVASVAAWLSKARPEGQSGARPARRLSVRFAARLRRPGRAWYAGAAQ
jgi:hypothetical protein